MLQQIQKLEKELAVSQQAATLSSSDAAKASASAAADATKEAAKVEAGLQVHRTFSVFLILLKSS